MYLEVTGLKKKYGNRFNTVSVLNGIELSVQQGQMCVIQGTSGSGKSTLLNCIGGLETIDEGSIKVDGKELFGLSPSALSDYRREQLGFIFQFYNLIPNLTAQENVELPLIYRGVGKKEREALAKESLKMVGLAHRMDHKPSEMSGGQQQRVAIARAIAAKPPVILADEPTGNLDSRSTQEIMNILKDLHKDGRTVILITHDDEIAAQVHRVIRIKDGKVEADFCNEETKGGHEDDFKEV